MVTVNDTALVGWLPMELVPSLLQKVTLPALFTAFASQRDVTGDVLRRCHRYGLGPRWLQSALAVLLPLSLARLVGFALPTHVWMLRHEKRIESTAEEPREEAWKNVIVR